MWEIWSSFVGFFEQSLILIATVTGSIGVAIILFTIATRVLILPLTLKSIRSSRKMQEVQPLIKELQRKYGKDQRRLQEETLKLYQEYKINPVGGCLPMFLQLPIFIGVYQAVIHLMIPEQHEYLNAAVRAAVEDANISLLLEQPIWGIPWRALNIADPATITNLVAEPFLGLNLGLAPFTDSTFQGVAYLILPVTAVVCQLGQQLMATPRVQDPQQQMMTRMMMFMPLVFAYIAFTFPAGAVLYWATSSVVGVVQQYFISGWGSLANYLKFLPPDKAKPALTPPAALSSSDDDEEAETSPERQRATFWGVLAPLTEAEPVGIGAAAGGGSVQQGASSAYSAPLEPDEAEEQGAADEATDETEQQRKPKGSRRQRRRR